MSRTLDKPRILFAVLLVTLTAVPLFAQTGKQSTGRVRLQRPAPNAVRRVETVSKELQKVLFDWFNATKQITKLTGQHKKYVYELTFSVEERGAGKFYYEAPDKGRIDIEPGEIKGQVSKRINPRTKKPFTLKAAQREKWLSTGKVIYQIEPDKNKATKFPIPPKAQGRNIMDGPLPFLLGMPPAKAIARYRLKLIRQTKDDVMLQVFPRWKSDAQNYKEAKVILNKNQHYLPSAVQLLNGDGRETVYTFFNFKVNHVGILKRLFGGRDWWNVDLTGYKLENGIPNQPVAAKRKQRRAAMGMGMPNLRGVSYSKALKILAGAKVKVEICAAKVAAKKSDITLIYDQLPPAGAPVRPGQKVFVSMFVDPGKFKAANMLAIPKLKGMHFKTASAELKKRGYRVEMRKGNVAENKNDLYKVDFQYPAAGQTALKQSKIILWLLVAAEDHKPQPKPKRTAARK